MTISHIAQCVGGVVSPILCNIYLHRLDDYVENTLIPENRGRGRGRGRGNQTAADQVHARRIVNYYLLAADVHRLGRLQWVMQTSMLKTLAGKHKSSVPKMAARFKANIETPHGTRTCFEAVRHRGNNKPQVARFGGIPLTRRRTAILHDRVPIRNPLPRKEIITRLQRGLCELCGLRGEVHAHHVAKLAELAPPGPHQPEWARLMATRRRKTLVVCPPCHDLIHNDPVQATPLTT